MVRQQDQTAPRHSFWLWSRPSTEPGKSKSSPGDQKNDANAPNAKEFASGQQIPNKKK
jgi:hypothetical protein